MRSAGFTLIELLIVITIVSLLTVVGIINFKNFSQDQVIVRASGQIQSLLRLANRNASTSVKCSDTEPAASWLLIFNTDQNSLTLKCTTPNVPLTVPPTFTEINIKTITLENNIEINGITPSCPGVDFPGSDVTLTYSVPLGQIDFVFARKTIDQPSNPECRPLNTTTLVVKVKNTRTEATKDIEISKGGEVNVK